jgi:hypothetical protein
VLDEQRDKVRHPVDFNLNIGKQVAARVRLPLDVGTTQCIDEAFDVTQREAQIVGDPSQPLGVCCIGPRRWTDAGPIRHHTSDPVPVMRWLLTRTVRRAGASAGWPVYTC